ncbi:hypothetical protein Vadar_031617 [Vaccinium darrowii]|uniref:Uncharacterized protein n=1 Tax=Vaccinium darrowii TaxID=229202 RepID=A0ACB7XUQ0_9ERIC|nr:hypothetical protein Vadar_031617 [Vaccinium darrowii]
MLRGLTLERSHTKEAMGFSLDNADAAGQIVEVLTESLMHKKPPYQEPCKVGLRNGRTPYRHASSCSKAGGLFCGFLIPKDCHMMIFCCNNLEKKMVYSRGCAMWREGCKDRLEFLNLIRFVMLRVAWPFLDQPWFVPNPLQRNSRCLLQNHLIGRIFKAMERHKCRFSPCCTNFEVDVLCHPFIDTWLRHAQWLHHAISIALRDESWLISDRMKHLLYEVPVRVAGGLLFELLGQSAGDPFVEEDDITIMFCSWQAQDFLITALHVKGPASQKSRNNCLQMVATHEEQCTKLLLIQSPSVSPSVGLFCWMYHNRSISLKIIDEWTTQGRSRKAEAWRAIMKKNQLSRLPLPWLEGKSNGLHRM